MWTTSTAPIMGYIHRVPLTTFLFDLDGTIIDSIELIQIGRASCRERV